MKSVAIFLTIVFLIITLLLLFGTNIIMGSPANFLPVPYIAQFNPNACGAAALEMVYKYFEILNPTQKAIFKKYQELEPEFGQELRISTENLVHDAQERGLNASWNRVDYLNKASTLAKLKEYVIKQKIPIIVCQHFTKQEPRIGHFRVITAIDDEDNIYFHDPHPDLGGKNKKWSIDEFMSYWQPTGNNVTGGVYIVITRK